MEQLRIKAQELRKKHEYKEAEKIYCKIYNENSFDKWLGWEYADTLKNLNKVDEAISVAKNVYVNNRSFKYIKDLLSWCVYEKYFKNLDANDTKELSELIPIADFLLKITVQDEKLPYEKTVFKIIKLIQKSDINNKYELMIEWLDKLDYKILSKNTYQIKMKNERTIEIASPLEDWFYIKIKCQYNLENYTECIENCDYILCEIEKFHNNQDKWIRRIKANCLWELNKKHESVMELSKLNNEFNHWIIMYELSKMYIEMENFNDGIIIASRLMLLKEPIERKVGAIKLLADLFYKLNKKKEAYVYYMACFEHIYNYDEKNLIKSRIKELNDTYNIKVINNIQCLEEIAIKEIKNDKSRKEGVVSNIIGNRKAGFIKDNISSYYFQMKNVLGTNKNIKMNDIVTFNVIDSFDRKKGKKSEEAIDLILE
ncbi:MULTISPECIES: hypothetical protein [unclassified Clostridium]|uniref:hypothetical protein n=1 Tax=unclassified Clostridium TaxID=2614128 RepID=UPI0025BC6CF5|nr:MULTISPECIES: hypothetical protein [unclassified Clostridium]